MVTLSVAVPFSHADKVSEVGEILRDQFLSSVTVKE
jgi:hypothetical protein